MWRLSTPGAAFLDRDGTINVKADDGDYIRHPEGIRLLPRVAEAIRRLNDAEVRVLVVTNQRGIARGLMSESDLAAVHTRLRELLEEAAGARIDQIFHCPHEAGRCDCRKPATGLFERAKLAHPTLDFRRSVMIGDADTDVEAGRRLSMKTFQIGVDAPDLATAVDAALSGTL